MKSFFKNLITLVGILLLAAIGYYLFATNNDATLDTSGVGFNNPQTQSEVFIRRLQDLQKIQLSDEFIQDSRFRSLVDFSSQVIPSPAGRSTPFQSTSQTVQINSNTQQ